MIVAHNDDYKTFTSLLALSVSQLQVDAQNRGDYYLSRGGINLEKDVYRIVNENAKESIYEGNIELISGQKFPDIVAYVNENKAYGIEVKTTKQNKWKSTGSSIFEGTRVDDVRNIHLLFGKLTTPVEFKCRKYEECLYDVAITHSPRYLIDMEIMDKDSIFSKVGVDYNTLRKLDNPFKPIKKYFRAGLKEGEDLWWIDSNEENVRDLGVKLWGNLSASDKNELRIMALAYFPSLLGADSKKYARLATWLVSRFGIVNHALRDTFSAGGQVLITGIKFPRIFEHITHDLGAILKIIQTIPEEDIKYYWKTEIEGENPHAVWIKQCLIHCKTGLNGKQFSAIKQILHTV